MPIYEITDPSGRTLEIEGDAPPTEADLDQIFSAVGTQPSQPPQTEQPKPFLPGMTSPGMPQPHPAIMGAAKSIIQSEQFPAAAAALGAGLATGGMGAIPAAATIGLAGAGGEAYRQIASGGEESPTEAAQKIGTRGLESALSELGVRSAIGIAKNLGPTVIGLFQKMPAEALKRVIARWQDMSPALKSVMSSQEGVERVGIKALRDSQKALEVARASAGKEVSVAMDGLHNAVGGQKIVNTSSVADALDAVLAEAKTGDEAVSAAISKSEIKRLQKIADAIRRDPVKDPKTANELRKALDALTTYKKGGALPIQSDLANRAAREMASTLRAEIGSVAKSKNYTALVEANSKFGQMMDLYNEMGPVIATKGRGDIVAAQRLGNVANLYYRGGVSKATLEEMAGAIPGGKDAVNTMLDAASMRALTVEPTTAPSNMMFNVIRLLGAPKIIGTGIKAAYTINPVMRPATIGATALADKMVRREKK